MLHYVSESWSLASVRLPTLHHQLMNDFWAVLWGKKKDECQQTSDNLSDKKSDSVQTDFEEGRDVPDSNLPDTG